MIWWFCEFPPKYYNPICHLSEKGMLPGKILMIEEWNAGISGITKKLSFLMNSEKFDFFVTLNIRWYNKKG